MLLQRRQWTRYFPSSFPALVVVFVRISQTSSEIGCVWLAKTEETVYFSLTQTECNKAEYYRMTIRNEWEIFSFLWLAWANDYGDKAIFVLSQHESKTYSPNAIHVILMLLNFSMAIIKEILDWLFFIIIIVRFIFMSFQAHFGNVFMHSEPIWV